MKNNPTLIQAVLILLFLPLYLPAQGQNPFEDCDDPSPFYDIAPVPLDLRKKNYAILGRLPDGTLFLKNYSGKNSEKYYWLEPNGQVKEIEFQEFITGMASLNCQTVYFKRESGCFIKAELDAELNIVDSEDFPCPEDWKEEISHPFFFYRPNTKNKAVIFASRSGKQEDYDLYISEVTDGWKHPYPLEHINTPYDEKHPTISKDGRLFFISNRSNPRSDCGASGELEPFQVNYEGKKDWKDTLINAVPSPIAHRAEEQSLHSIGLGLSKGYFTSNRQDTAIGKVFKLYSFQDNTLPKKVKPKYKALIIGIDAYTKLGKLKEMISKGRRLAQVLENTYHMEVETLFDCTKAEILEKLQDYQTLEEDEYLFIAYFGHGFPAPSLENPESCRLTGRESTKQENLIHPDEFYRAILAIKKPKYIALMLDVCHGGVFNPIDPAITQTLAGSNKVREVLSSTFKETIPENSSFLGILIDQLDDGKLNPYQEMTMEYCSSKVIAEVKDSNPTYRLLFGTKEDSFPFPMQCVNGRRHE